MTIRIFHGETLAQTVAPDDRGLNYGDGLFETIRVHAAKPVWWPEHWQRLALGAQRLGIALPDEQRIQREMQALIGQEPRAVLKLLLTRGRGGRGYAAADGNSPTLVISKHEVPPLPPQQSINVRWCRTTLAIQPLLAGIKHLNRLEQVLARAEWRDSDIFEGLMCDVEGRVVCATAANLFIRVGGRWLTPPVYRCGIAGIARSWLLGQLRDAAEADLSPYDVINAEAVFLCNAVRGILPVGRIGDKYWPEDAGVTQLRKRLALAEPAFAILERF